MCELIRAEQHNKLSLLGLYARVIFVPTIPATFQSLSFLQRWEPTPDEQSGTQFMFSVRLTGPGGFDRVVLPPNRIAIPPPPLPIIQMALTMYGLEFTQQGEYQLATSINETVQSRHTFLVAIPTPDQQRALSLAGFL
jgi:hypothetical protein